MNNDEKILQLKKERDKARSELYVLYEISNAMRTSLKLYDVLYIILTGVTAHAGLGFNRAMLFLVNEKKSRIEGKMGIGPHSGEEADKIWKQIDKEKSDLHSLIENYKASNKMADSKFNRLVLDLKFPLEKETGGIIAAAITENKPIHITKDKLSNYHATPLLKKIHMDEFAVVPMITKDKTIGAIVVDNIFNKKAITPDEIRILTMFATQAGLAIENSKLYEKTVLQSQINSLTRLWNHGYCQYKLKEEVKKAKEIKSPLSLIMLDLDNFKALNDTLGHQTGDQVLKDTSAIIKEYCRKSDYPCRYGGEEFAIILPHTNKEQAYAIAERIREAIENYKFSYNKTSITKKISISLGISCLGTSSNNNKTILLSNADKALYEAKHTGKNKTIIYNE